MLLTVKEAETKWCPLTFAVKEIRGADGSGIREGGPWPCCGTGCMAWRTVEYASGERPVPRGYCGLAGRPA